MPEIIPAMNANQLSDAYSGTLSRLTQARAQQNQMDLQRRDQMLQEQQFRQKQQKETALNELSALSLKDPRAMAQLASVDPDRAKKNQDFLFSRSEREAAYATAVNQAPRDKKAAIYKSVRAMAINDPLVDRDALSSLPDQYTPDLDAHLYAISQSHRSLENALKAQQEAATLAGTQAQTRQTEASTAKTYADLAKTKEETRNLRMGGGEKAPTGYRFVAGGNLEKIPGGPADKESGETAKVATIAADGLSTISNMRELLYDKGKLKTNAGKLLGGSSFLPSIAQPQETQKLSVTRDNLSDLIGRLRSGGAINKDEEARYLRLVPKYGDKSETINFKIKQLEKNFNTLQTTLGGTSNVSNEGGDPLGLFK